MKITKLTPQGFCKGVANAINIINKAIEDPNIKKPIYMLGNIVHNKNVVNAFREKGIIILDGKTRVNMLDEIYEGTVIFTAHGVSDEVKEIAKNKGLNIIDATCKDVTHTHNIIRAKLNEGYTVLFYGKNGHPETEGAIGISNKIILIEDNTNINDLPIITNKIILITQTTMSFLDVIKIHQKLLSIYPQLELLDEVCSATRIRQEAVINAKNFDLIIVVGDKLSNNTRMLKEVAIKYANTKSISIESINDLKGIDLSDYRNIAITAGASTPKVIVDEILINLENELNVFVSKITNEDYLKI